MITINRTNAAMAAPTIRRIFVVLEEAGLCGADAGGTPLSGGTGLAGDGVRGGCQAVTGAAGTGEGNTDALGEALPVTLRITRVPHCSQNIAVVRYLFPACPAKHIYVLRLSCHFAYI
jgi:hypothetical protein